MTRLPLTAAQSRLWLECRVDPSRAGDRITAAWDLRGAVDARALHDAIALVSARHDALRVSLELDEPAQRLGDPRLEWSLTPCDDALRLTLAIPPECADERSFALLVREIGTAYAGRSLPHPVPYVIDAAPWDESSIAAWSPPARIAPELEGDDPGAAAIETRPLPPALASDRARLLSTFVTLIQRHAGCDSITIGVTATPSSSTPFGCFDTLLPLTIDDARQAPEAWKRLAAHASIPFPRLLEILRPTRRAGEHPLFEITFAFAHERVLQLPNVEATPIVLAPPRATADLAFHAGETATLVYRSALWPRAWAAAFLEQYEAGTAGSADWPSPSARAAHGARREQPVTPSVVEGPGARVEARTPFRKHEPRASIGETGASAYRSLPHGEHRVMSSEARSAPPDDDSVLRITPHEARKRIARTIRPQPLTDVRAVVFHGEPVSGAWIARWRSAFPGDAPLFTLYEDACLFEVPDPAPRGMLPIGRPLPGVDVRVIARDGADCVQGEIGALSIDGRRTGDLARIRSDGMLELCGRLDRAVWIDGERVDPANIERALLATPHIREARVIAEEGVDGERRLVAHIAADRRHLDVLAREHPSLILRATADDETGELLAPRDPIELQLARLWEEILDCDRIGITDDFFDRGGDSLRAVALLARIERELGVTLDPAALLPDATIEALAHSIRHARPADPLPLVTIQRGAHRPPLVCVHPSGGSILCYVDLARLLGRERHVAGLRGPDPRSLDAPPEDAREMASRYVAALRTAWPDGPYVLAGYSFGGLIAFEMAHQLRGAGAEIALVALLDSRFPPAATSDGKRAEGPGQPALPGGRNPVDDFGEVLERHDLEAPGEAAEHALWQDLIALAARYVPDERRGRRGLASVQEFCRRYRLMPASDALGYHDLRRFLRNLRANFRAMRHYQPPPLDAARVVLFTAVRTLDGGESDHARNAALWRTVAPSLEIHPIDANHFNLLAPPAVSALADALRERLP